ncbi:MAG: hypothetical protein MUD08_15770 [Cytophagales bacterium]|jgi:hypothetical protein|nr:hypothetical protein [Cytophagales bacterium]
MKQLRNCTLGTVLAVFLIIYASRAQHIPLGALPMQFNSSFAGESGAPRLNHNLSIQTPGTHVGTQVLNYASYDQFVPQIRTGVGASVSYSNEAGNARMSQSAFATEGAAYSVSLAVAPKLSMKGKYTLSPSVEVLYGRYQSEYNNWPTAELPQKIEGERLLGRASLLFNSQKWYVGASYLAPLSSETRYRIAGISGVDPLTPSFYWQFGYTFQRRPESKFSVTPQVVFRTGWVTNQLFEQFRLTAFMLNLRYGKFVWGLNNAGFHVGLQSDRMRLLISQFASRDFEQTSYVGSLSFRYVLKRNGEAGKSRW